MMSTKEHYGTLFPTAVVGSMPRPAFVREVVMGERDLDAGRKNLVMDDAVRYAVRLQEEAGLDIITDGEWRRASYIGVIAELAHGFEVGKNPKDGRPWTVVVDEVRSKDTHFIVEEAKFLKQITDAKIKVTLPAPALLGERMWDSEASAKAYPTRRAFVEACVPILRREVELLRDAGVAVVQIDDPHLCLLVDDDVRAGYDDPDAEADFSAAMNNALVEGIDGVRFAVHLCRRAGARVRGEACHTGGYEPIIPYLNQLKVHHLTMEFTSPGAGDAEVFRFLREDFEIGLGCVSVHPGEVDMADVIVERVESAMSFLAPERIVLNPDCGFAPGSAAKVDIDEVYEKMKQEVEAAKRLREKYG
jgi:5-methyltetrahydropteroyltriglutamate--homocysteine methyltransferase